MARRRRHRILFVSATVLAAAALVVPATAGADRWSVRHGGGGGGYSVALTGDFPYDASQIAKIPALRDDIDAAGVAFTIFDGDIKSGASDCADQLYLDRKADFDAFARPFVFLPGDNDWTDCHRFKGPDGKSTHDPVERLDFERRLFFATDQSLGQETMTLTRQADVDPAHAKFVENARWTKGGVVFVTLNLQGSNNNAPNTTKPVATFTPGQAAEYAERNAADLAWIRDSFAYARDIDARGIMLVQQGDPDFENLTQATGSPLFDATYGNDGFNDTLALLQSETIDFAPKPVVLVHGDSHYFRIDQPMTDAADLRKPAATARVLENFTRVETFGNPNVFWVEARIDPGDPAVFRFVPHQTAANQEPHSPLKS
jgi:hypothetical protein